MKQYSETKNSRKSHSLIQNKGIKIAYQCWFIILGITLLALSISSYSSFQYAIESYQYIILNWNQQPIIDIKITNGTCSQDEEALIEYEWPGTMDGCDCQSERRLLSENEVSTITNENHRIISQKCNETQLKNGCKIIKSLDQKQFNLFPSSNNQTGFQLCARRETDNNFYKWLPKRKDCKEGFLKCGENEDVFYCTSEKVCPIRRIGIKGKIKLENEEEGNTFEADTIIYSRNSSDYLPIVEFRIGQGGICLKNNELGIPNEKEEYPLLKVKRKQCQYDTRFEEVVLATEDIFFKINGYSNITQALAGYQISKVTQWGLYQRSYIPWKMKCRGQEFNEFLLQQIYLNEIFDGLTSQLVISVFFFFTLSILLSALSYMNIIGKQIPWISTDDTKETQERIFYVELVFKFIIYVPYATLIALEFSKIQKELIFFEQIINLNCSDSYVINQLISMKESLNGTNKMNSAQFYLFFITILIDILNVGLICYFKRKH